MRTLAVFLLAAAACGGASPSSSLGKGAATQVSVATLEDVTTSFPESEDHPASTMGLPRVTVHGNPAASDAINRALGVPATGDTLEDNGEAGLTYTVDYNADGLLAVQLNHETMGAYPDSYSEAFVFDLATGARLRGADLFAAGSMADLVALLDGKVQSELSATRAEQPDCVTADVDPFEGPFHYSVGDLDLVSLTPNGVQFMFDYAFPHVIQACEPAGVFTVPVAELKAYLRADGPLVRLVE